MKSRAFMAPCILVGNDLAATSATNRCIVINEITALIDTADNITRRNTPQAHYAVKVSKIAHNTDS
jgi:hypothetical protein